MAEREETLKKRKDEEEASHPLLSHVDRLLVAREDGSGERGPTPQQSPEHCPPGEG
jgi:hypothetical protein